MDGGREGGGNSINKEIDKSKERSLQPNRHYCEQNYFMPFMVIQRIDLATCPNEAYKCSGVSVEDQIYRFFSEMPSHYKNTCKW